MRILVTGKTGQLVTSLLERAAASERFEVIAAGRPELDLGDPRTIERAVTMISPDVIISAAAYTAVDNAEKEPSLAYSINALGAGAVAHAADRIGAPVIHLSTDYVFSGRKRLPYDESDDIAPLGVYGQSKRQGELAVMSANARHVILRTAWLYSPFGNNFVKTMLRLAQVRKSIRVVADQWGNPTSALDLADAILHMLPRLEAAHFGVYHLAGQGATNWSGLASHVLSVSGQSGGPHAEIEEIPSSEYPTLAVRPLNSQLSSKLFEQSFGWRMPNWEESASLVTKRLVGASPRVDDRKSEKC